MTVHLGGGDTNVVQESQLKDLIFAQFRSDLSVARKHHKAHPFAMVKGVNPNQIQGVREAIRELGRDKAVLLSTHILSEVEAVCDRVVLIDRGTLQFDGTPDERQWTVITSTRGPLAGRRIVRGREGECRRFYLAS